MSVCPGVSGDGPDRFVWSSLSRRGSSFLEKAIVVRRDARRHQGLRDRFAVLELCRGWSAAAGFASVHGELKQAALAFGRPFVFRDGPMLTKRRPS
jgi:hypothetical protein